MMVSDDGNHGNNSNWVLFIYCLIRLGNNAAQSYKGLSVMCTFVTSNIGIGSWSVNIYHMSMYTSAYNCADRLNTDASRNSAN